VSSFRVALTFDAEHPDRPAAPGNADRLLDELDRLDVHASFFVHGRWAEAYPTSVRRIVAAGHLVGSHSHYHVRMPLLSAKGLETDVRDAEEAIREHAGVDPRPWFRCPFGAGADDRVLVGRLAALGYRDVGWHVSPEDWNPANSPADVIRTVVDGAAEQGDGAVVLLHSWPDRTLAAIPEVVSRLRDVGATLGRLDELPDVPGLSLEPQIAGDR
jgi:peptidoglycan/xylan/chitin deacetylase (PgdA/CDA1 family)